jgi:hypothetical protein
MGITISQQGGGGTKKQQRGVKIASPVVLVPLGDSEGVCIKRAEASAGLATLIRSGDSA